ncbi:unnamed protein product, partial [Brenthis ino]
MSEYILKVIEHYKQPNPEGLPGVKFPDPYYIPDIRQPLGFATSLVFSETKLYGVNKFRMPYIIADLGKMQCSATLELDNLQIRGKYSYNMFLNSHQGSFTANITGIRNIAVATLGVERDGKLRAQNISIDITFKNIAVNFENAGLLAVLLQGVFNSMGAFLYDSIKPYILRDAHENVREAINSKIDQFVGDIKFPNTISPLDMIMVDLRKKIKLMKMDPLEIDDYYTNLNIFKISINNTRIKGLSSLHRMGNISFKIENHTVIADFNIGSQELEGSTRWEFSGIKGFISVAGTNSFSIQHIKVKFKLVQALDTRKRMELKDLEVEVGNIQLRSDGAGTMDYLLELTANILPNLLRYQILRTLQNPLRWKLQQELNEINIEEEIINKLPEIDKMQEIGFKLSEFRFLNYTDEPCYDEDDFFNF